MEAKIITLAGNKAASVFLTILGFAVDTGWLRLCGEL